MSSTSVIPVKMTIGWTSLQSCRLTVPGCRVGIYLQEVRYVAGAWMRRSDHAHHCQPAAATRVPSPWDTLQARPWGARSPTSSAIAPALLYLLHPCSRVGSRSQGEGTRIPARLWIFSHTISIQNKSLPATTSPIPARASTKPALTTEWL